MKTREFELQGNIVDVVAQKLVQGTIKIADGRIREICEGPADSRHFIMPGLVDAHIHVESSLLIPSEFARLAVVHGTVGTVSDPHEIANVLGIPGILFMISNGKKVPFKFSFGASSCVPATAFETAGADLGISEIGRLLEMKEIGYLSEMMNYPGVLSRNPEVMGKLTAAKNAGKPIDGHAPGLRGEDARRYAEAGITTDHECFTKEEALDKLKYGMKILIREGSAAKNFEALCSLIDEFPHRVMLCSDDKHPNDLVKGHMNELVKKSVAKGFDFFNIIRSCTFNPVKHYNLPVGLLQKNDPADLIVVDNLRQFSILATYIDGIKVAEEGQSLLESQPEEPANKFKANPVTKEKLRVNARPGKIRIQKALDGQLITQELDLVPLIKDNQVVADTERDILKLVVVNRYNQAPPAIGFVNGFGLKRGAMASCVAHDSHNVLAVGADDYSLIRAINLIIQSKGGISWIDGQDEKTLPLPFAGIMSGNDGYQVAKQYEAMDHRVKTMGSGLTAPYMTLSFMALLVIPELKLSDKGLFDGRKFAFSTLFY